MIIGSHSWTLLCPLAQQVPRYKEGLKGVKGWIGRWLWRWGSAGWRGFRVKVWVGGGLFLGKVGRLTWSLIRFKVT